MLIAKRKMRFSTIVFGAVDELNTTCRDQPNKVRIVSSSYRYILYFCSCEGVKPLYRIRRPENNYFTIS